MNKEDARKLPASAQEEKRKLAIKLWKKNKRIKDIAEIVDVTPKAVGGWIKRYQVESTHKLHRFLQIKAVLTISATSVTLICNIILL